MSTTGHEPTDPRFSTARVGTPIPLAAGIPVLLPEPKSHAYSTNPPLGLVFSPVVQGISVSIAVGAGPVAVALVGSEIQVSALLPGTTTYANLLAAWNAAPGVLAAAVLTGNAGTFPVGYAGMAATALATIRPSNADGMVGLCTDGVWRPVRLTTDGSIEVSVTIGDEMKVHPYLPVGGATATEVVGVSGRIPKDHTFTIAGTDTVLFHPLVPGVSVVVATAAAEAVTVVGKVVTFTTLNTDLSTVTTMRATLAASPAAGLVSIELGTAVVGDTWNHLLVLAETALWVASTVEAGAILGLDPTGYYAPLSSDVASPQVKCAASTKFAGIDAGAVTVTNTTTLGFTGVNLLGKALYALDVTSGRSHEVASVTDPAGATAGIITLRTALTATTDTVIVAYASTPHAWSSAADAMQTMAVVGAPPRVNGPATFISTTAAIANNTYQYILPCALYGRMGIQIVWSAAAGTRDMVFNAYGKIDTAAWAAAGAIPAAYAINGVTDWHYSDAGSTFGAAAATAGVILCWTDEPRPWNSVAIEMVVTNTDANNSTVTANYVIYDGTK